MSPSFACGRCPEFEVRVKSLELRPDPNVLLSEIVRLSANTEEAKAAALAAREDIAALRAEVDRLAEWRVDSKDHEIAELRRTIDETLKADRASLHDIVLDERKAVLDKQGDRRKFRYALVLALVGAAASGVIGVRATAHPQCSHAAVGP